MSNEKNYNTSRKSRFWVSLGIGGFLGMFFGAEMQQLLIGIGLGIFLGAILGLLLLLIPFQREDSNG